MKFMKRKATKFLPVLLLLPFGIANAADSGLYIGGSVGQAALDLGPTILQLDFDENETAWKLLLGYNFEFGPINLGVEGGYVDLGDPSVESATASLQIESTGFIGFGVAGIEVGPIDLFAKVGAIAWDVEARISGSRIDDAVPFAGSHSGADVAYGIGAGFDLSKLGIRVEYEGYDISHTDTTYMLSLGVVYRF